MMKKYELLLKTVVMIAIILFSSRMITSKVDGEVSQQESKVEIPSTDTDTNAEAEVEIEAATFDEEQEQEENDSEEPQVLIPENEENNEPIDNDLTVEDTESQKKREHISTEMPNRGGVDRGVFVATAYDLSYASCQKEPSHPAYGITANGTSLKGHTLESARAIAVDRTVIPLGSKVYVEFLDDEYSHLSAEFTAVDVGGAIKGQRIDVFFGSGDVAEDVKQFGRRKVRVTVLD